MERYSQSLGASFAKGWLVKDILVRDYMTSPAASIPATSSLLEAVLTMRRSSFRHLPITVEDDRLVGIITLAPSSKASA